MFIVSKILQYPVLLFLSLLNFRALLLFVFLCLPVLPVGAEDAIKLSITKNAETEHRQTVLQDVLVAPPSLSAAAERGQTIKVRDQHRFATIPVFYATTRMPGGDKLLSYSKARGLKLDYGVCEVTRPFSDEEPRSPEYLSNLGWKIADDGSRSSHPHHSIEIPRRFASADAMFSAIKQIQAKSAEKRLIVFIHGYAASFNKAARIGARLAYGTGIPVLIFSWPTQHNFLIYTADECNAEWTYPRFQKFLSMLNASFSPEDITLISHSMGARIVSWALQNTPEAQLSNQINRGRYQHIFFCCPDIDKDTFETYAERIQCSSKNTVVFVSGNDVRLGFSEILHGHARLGEFNKHPENLVSIPGIEIVDFTALDSTFGHAMPYPLIFKALNHDALPPGIELVHKNDNTPSAEVVKIAGKR